MSDKTTIAVSKDTKTKAKNAKHPMETWDQFIQRLSEEPPNIQAFVPVEEVVEAFGDGMENADDLRDTLEVLEERTGRIERQLEDLQR